MFHLLHSWNGETSETSETNRLLIIQAFPFFLNEKRKYRKLSDRNTIFTTLANGGAPYGHSCPNSTTAFSINSSIRNSLLDVFIIMFIESKIIKISLCKTQYDFVFHVVSGVSSVPLLKRWNKWNKRVPMFQLFYHYMLEQWNKNFQFSTTVLLENMEYWKRDCPKLSQCPKIYGLVFWDGGTNSAPPCSNAPCQYKWSNGANGTTHSRHCEGVFAKANMDVAISRSEYITNKITNLIVWDLYYTYSY